jgi:hypothetical protein
MRSINAVSASLFSSPPDHSIGKLAAEQAQATFASLDDSIQRTETLLDKRCRVLNHDSGGKGKKDVLKSFLERM